jgi:hypothetical protein
MKRIIIINLFTFLTLAVFAQTEKDNQKKILEIQK